VRQVSNHGGRQLDAGLGSFAVLPVMAHKVIFVHHPVYVITDSPYKTNSGGWGNDFTAHG
jgi:hypothetical protein